MKLILLRHGQAEDFDLEGDFQRPLTEKGREQARSAGKFLSAKRLLPDIVLTSPLVRARQTAEAFSEAAGISEPVVQDWLASGMHPSQGAKELSAFGEFATVMIVGHEPDFSDLVAWFLGINKGAVEVKKGGLIALEVRPPSQVGVLHWVIPPNFR